MEVLGEQQELSLQHVEFTMSARDPSEDVMQDM